MECFRLLLEPLAWIDHRFLSDIRDSRKAASLWGMMRGVGGVRKLIHQTWLAKGLGLLCWGFKGAQEEIPSEDVSILQIGSVAFPPGQGTSPQLHPCQSLLPVTFRYSLSLQAVVMRQLRRWKRLWQMSLTRSQKGLPCALLEGVRTVQHCIRKRLLRRGLNFLRVYSQ